MVHRDGTDEDAEKERLRRAKQVEAQQRAAHAKARAKLRAVLYAPAAALETPALSYTEDAIVSPSCGPRSRQPRQRCAARTSRRAGAPPACRGCRSCHRCRDRQQEQEGQKETGRPAPAQELASRAKRPVTRTRSRSRREGQALHRRRAAPAQDRVRRRGGGSEHRGRSRAVMRHRSAARVSPRFGRRPRRPREGRDACTPCARGCTRAVAAHRARVEARRAARHAVPACRGRLGGVEKETAGERWGAIRSKKNSVELSKKVAPQLAMEKGGGFLMTARGGRLGLDGARGCDGAGVRRRAGTTARANAGGRPVTSAPPRDSCRSAKRLVGSPRDSGGLRVSVERLAAPRQRRPCVCQYEHGPHCSECSEADLWSENGRTPALHGGDVLREKTGIRRDGETE